MITLTPQPLWQHSSAWRISVDIADAFEAVIGAAFGQVDEIGHEVALDLVRIDEMGHAEFLGQRLAPRVDVDADDHVGADQLAPWMTLSPIPPSPKMTTLAPGSTFAVLITAPMPVVTPQPI